MPLSPSRRTAKLGPSIVRRLFDARRPTSINLGLGEPTSPVPYELLDAGFARYRERRMGYSMNAGMMELRERIVAHYRMPHIRQPKNVVVTVGAQEGIFAALMSVADPGDEVIVLDPSFWTYRNIAEILGIQVVAVPTRRDFALDVEALAAAITPKTRAIVLNSPSNPTGRVDSEATLRELVRVTEASGVWLISDEVYQELYYAERRPTSIGELTDRAIVVTSLSKSCSMTGFRLGFVLVPDALATALASVHLYNVTSTATISQYLALEVFDKPSWLAVNRPQFTVQRTAIFEAIDRHLGLPYVPTEGGFFVFLDMRSTGLESLPLAEKLLAEADVITVPGIAFGKAGEHHLRLSFTEAPPAIDEGIRRIAAWLEQRKSS